MPNSSLSKENYDDVVRTSIIRLVATIILGIVAGYLVYRTSVKQESPNIYYFVVISVVFIVYGIIEFLVKVLKAKKKYKK